MIVKIILTGFKNKTVLDIGCNDGSLLNIFKKYKCTTIGIEPTNASKEAKKNGHHIYQGYIDNKIIKKLKKNLKKLISLLLQTFLLTLKTLEL